MKKSIILLLSFLVFLFSSCDEEIVSTGGGGSSNNNTGNTKGAETISSCRINSETKWTNHNDGIDYVVNCKNLQIYSSLTIEPGTTVAFGSDARLTIEEDGYIVAKGTSSKKITFTGMENLKGFWRGIAIKSPDVRNAMDYVVIEYTGSSPMDALYYNFKCALTLLRSNAGKLSLTNSTIRESDGIGFVASETQDIRAFSGNTISNCNEAMVLSASNVSSISGDNMYSGNNFNGITIRKSDLEENTAVTWQKANYYVRDDLMIKSPLTLKGGTFHIASAKSIEVWKGSLKASNVTFTGEEKISGFWNGIGFAHSASSQNQFNNVIVEYAGGNKLSSYYGNFKFAVGVWRDSKLSLNNCTIRYSDSCGIYKSSSSAIHVSNVSYNSNKAGNFCTN